MFLVPFLVIVMSTRVMILRWVFRRYMLSMMLIQSLGFNSPQEIVPHFLVRIVMTLMMMFDFLMTFNHNRNFFFFNLRLQDISLSVIKEILFIYFLWRLNSLSSVLWPFVIVDVVMFIKVHHFGICGITQLWFFVFWVFFSNAIFTEWAKVLIKLSWHLSHLLF